MLLKQATHTTLEMGDEEGQWVTLGEENSTHSRVGCQASLRYSPSLCFKTLAVLNFLLSLQLSLSCLGLVLQRLYIMTPWELGEGCADDNE